MFSNLSRRWFGSWFSGDATRRRAPATASRSYRPVLEALEDRTLLTLYLVNALTDSSPATGGAGSGTVGDLRYALTHANSNGSSSNNTIEFVPGTQGMITLKAALPEIGNNLSLIGPGPMPCSSTPTRCPIVSSSFFPGKACRLGA